VAIRFVLRSKPSSPLDHDPGEALEVVEHGLLVLGFRHQVFTGRAGARIPRLERDLVRVDGDDRIEDVPGVAVFAPQVVEVALSGAVEGSEA